MSAVPPPPQRPVPAPEPTQESAREELMRYLDRETAVARATDGRLAVLLVELRRVDRLQALLKGPGVATTMALVLERLRKIVRPEDRVAAISDDEVCMVLPRLAHPSQAVLAAVKALRALDRPIAYEGGSAVLRPCVGISTVPEHGFGPDELLRAADIARRIAATREEGYHVVVPEDAIESEMYRGLDLELERAIRASELSVAYQPQVDVATGKPVGAEALIRWRHAQAGDVPAPTIIGIAERTGLIGALTHSVLNTVLRNSAQMRRDGLEPHIAVNLSTRSLADDELPILVDQALKTWSVPASSVTLEITESSVIADAERSQAMLTRLKAIGVDLSMDDFGTGYSSLAYLKRFPLDELKIDRQFVAGLLNDAGDRRIVRAVIDLAHNFELRAIAEGVEDAQVLDALRRLGCDRAQGYHFCRPLGEKAFRDWWAARVNAP